MRELIAHQSCETPEATYINKCYKTETGYEDIKEVWIPRIKFFRPPCWAIFRWAYKVKLSPNVHAVETDVTEGPDGPHVTQIGIQICKSDKGVEKEWIR